jgi:hypothetical protein
MAAAPSYIERHGEPMAPEALSDHSFIVAGPAARKGLTLRHGSKLSGTNAADEDDGSPAKLFDSCWAPASAVGGPREAALAMADD